MLAPILVYAVMFADPVVQVQLRYPVTRTTFTTTSGDRFLYTVPAETPAELRRAYKVLEVAERDVRITEALQLLREEVVQNERRLEALRAARMMDYLTYRLPNPRATFDPALIVPPESSLKFGVSVGLASDARVERALAALDRLADAQDQLQQARLAVAYPNRPRPLPGPRAGAAAPAPVVPPAPTVPFSRTPVSLADAEKAEKAAAEAEAEAERRDRNARHEESVAETRYRDASGDNRDAARVAWVKALDTREHARREWDTARGQWKAARAVLNAARLEAAAPVRTAPDPGSSTRAKPVPASR